MFPGSSKLFARAALPCAAALCLALAAPAGATTSTDVKRAMNALGGGAGAYAWNVTDRHAVAGRKASTARILASNTKLFTTAAVLARYGTGGRFSTGVYTDGSISGGVLSGDIYIRGGGDPLFGNASYVTTNFGSGATLESLAKSVKAAGVKQITGTIYGDESAWDAKRGTAYSNWGRSSDIGGVLGGLIVNKGFVSGRYQSNPPVYAAQRLAAALKSAGVTVSSKAAAKTTPASARRIASVRSLPMSALVRQMDKPSNNYLAEMLVKSLAMPASAGDDDSDGGEVPLGAKRATTQRGYTAAERFAAGLGSKVRLIDGSGLSRSDHAAPREVVDLLRGVQRRVQFTDFKAALPIAGVDGTLASRMRSTAAYKKCSAKTGTLSNVSSLSGYCTSAGGDLIAFSILQNRVSPSAAHGQQDRVAAAIAGLR